MKMREHTLTNQIAAEERMTERRCPIYDSKHPAWVRVDNLMEEHHILIKNMAQQANTSLEYDFRMKDGIEDLMNEFASVVTENHLN